MMSLYHKAVSESFYVFLTLKLSLGKRLYKILNHKSG